LLAESFQLSAQVDTTRLQRQIEELSTKLENTQISVTIEPKKNVQFENEEQEESADQSTEEP